MSVKMLAIDTATENCSVALIVDGKMHTRNAIAPREHTVKILPFVDEVLKEAEVELDDLDALVFGQGPGSFTGVRIGIGVAQGLAFGAELPMIGVSTLEAMAQAAYRLKGSTQVVAAIDARMNEVYFGMYQRNDNGSWKSMTEEMVSSPAELNHRIPMQSGEWLGVGTGWQAYEEEFTRFPLTITMNSSDILYPDAQDMLSVALHQFKQGAMVPVEEATPVYIRDNVTWKKLPGRE